MLLLRALIAPRPPSNRLARLATLALALVCLAGQLTTAAHLALVQHTTCEHGELVEAAPPGLAQAGDTGLSAPDEAAAATHSHDHCVLNASRRDGPRFSRLLAPLAVSVLLPPSLRADLPPLPAIALILVAPKSSPPA